MVFGAAVKLAVHGIALWKNMSFENTGIHSGYIRAVWVLAWPLLIGIIFSQISTLTDNVFASWLQEGSISALNYAKKVVELPVLVFPYALSIVVFPFFSELHIEKDLRRLRHLLRETLKWIAIVFIPLSVLLFFFSDPVTQLVFQRGAFDGSAFYFCFTKWNGKNRFVTCGNLWGKIAVYSPMDVMGNAAVFPCLWTVFPPGRNQKKPAPDQNSLAKPLPCRAD
jgi:O-antigen/teichoic acid export membrane protein